MSMEAPIPSVKLAPSFRSGDETLAVIPASSIPLLRMWLQMPIRIPNIPGTLVLFPLGSSLVSPGTALHG